MNWQVSDLIKIKERKSPAQPSKGQKNHWEPKNETGPGYLGIPMSLGSLGHVVGSGWD